MSEIEVKQRFPYKTEPAAHQRRYLQLGAARPYCGLFWGTGAGKTKAYLDNAAYLYLKGKIDALIFLAPNGPHQQIVDEAVPDHMTEAVPHRAAFWRAGARNKAIEEVAKAQDCLAILSFNSEGLSYDSMLEPVTRALKTRRSMLVVDESHLFMTPSSKRTRTLRRIGKLASYRRIGTGTPQATGFENLYAPLSFLSTDILGVTTYTAFKSEYCVLAGEFNEIVGYRNVAELMRKISPHIFVAETKDCWDLPEQQWLERRVELTDEQRRLIRELRDNYITTLESGEIIEGELAIQRLQKVQHITSGHVRLEDGSWKAVPNHSLQSAVDFVLEASGKVVIWASWHPDILQLSETFKKNGISHVTYFGGNTAAQNMTNKLSFVDPAGPRVFLATTASGGTGLDGLQRVAFDAMYYSLTFDSIDYWQSLGRLFRPGQKERVTYTTLIRPGTTDAKLIAALRRKENLAAQLRNPEIFKGWLDGLLRVA